MMEPQTPIQWAKVIDHTRCIGCHACTTACKSENVVPLSVTRTYVKHVDIGVFPQARRAHQVTRCNQCAHAPCVTACPTTAMFKRADGIVDRRRRHDGQGRGAAGPHAHHFQLAETFLQDSGYRQPGRGETAAGRAGAG